MAGDIGINFAGNVLSNLFCDVWNKGVEKGKMVIYLPQAFNQMKEDVGTLDNEIHDINADLNRKQWPAKRRVQTWLDKAAELQLTSETIVTEYDTYQQHKSCLGCSPNCVRRYRISNDIRDWTRKFSELKSEKAQPDFPRIGEYGDPTPRKQILIQDSDSGFVADSKRSTHTELLENWLTDEDSKILGIGIIGMGGVGKTSLLNIINDSQKVKTSFDYIIKVTVSRNNVSDLQKQVAERLNIKEFPDYFDARKDMLRNFLKEKIVLFLLDDMWADDIWTRSKLQDLGASLNDKGFKIVLTTRNREVCERMNVQKTIEVEPLVQEEGWQLFRSRAFENLNGNVPQELEEVAREIAKECKGLPLAITVIAAAMKEHGTFLHQWQIALDHMKNVPEMFDGLHSIVDKELFQRLRWSYDVLKPDMKTCFLSFAAFPEDREISCEEVIDIWIAEGIVKGSGNSYLRDTADGFLNHLRNRCLIEVVKTDEVGRISRAKIHDILRDLAIRIAEKEHGCYFKAGQGVPDFPEEVDRDHCAKMSLMSNNIQRLPLTFKCSSLSVLLLSENPDIKEVPESFLKELPSLRILDLSRTGITCLPPSIGNLKRLAFLQLHHTDICELPETIGNLKDLQFLNVNSCHKLRCLPERINELKRLRVLDTEFCDQLRYLPRGISELVALERLNTVRSISLSFEDLQSLRRLRVLSVTTKSPVKEGVMGNWSKMRNLWLYFDDDVNQDELPQDMQAMKDLEIFALWNCDVERLPSCLTQFRKLAGLSLDSCKQLKELPAELPCLRQLSIFSCDKLEELELGMGFPKLETVVLFELKSLECVGAGEGAAASGSGSGGLGEGASPLPMLKTLWVAECPKLKRLRGGLDKLKCLEEISGWRKWWDAMGCDDPSIKTSLQSKYKAIG